MPDKKDLPIARMILLLKHLETSAMKIGNYLKSVTETAKMLALSRKIFGCANCDGLRKKML